MKGKATTKKYNWYEEFVGDCNTVTELWTTVGTLQIQWWNP